MTTAAVEPRAGERAPLGALSTDHKAVAIRLAWLCGAFFLAGGVLALLVRSELAVPGMQIVSHQGYDQLFTMHGSTMVYLVVQPLAVALGVYLVPLQIGAAEIAPAPPSSPCGSSPAAEPSCTSASSPHGGAGRPDGRPSPRSRATGSPGLGDGHVDPRRGARNARRHHRWRPSCSSTILRRGRPG